MTQPPYQAGNEWYFIVSGHVFGPYHNRQEAWTNYRIETGTDMNCKQCQDE